MKEKVRPKNYSYPVFLIQMVLSIKMCTSSSFRAVAKTIAIFNLYLNISVKTPSYATILIWTKKLGCYQFEKTIEKTNDWILIIDESIQFGHEKLLVIYGIRASTIDFTKALNYKDLTPLTISAKTSWTGILIKEEIDKIKEKTGDILYGAADSGNSICKSFVQSDICHVNDVTHKIALFLKKMYKDNTSFIEYTKKLAKIRTGLVLSDVAHILPPKQRINSRFMNLEIISNYGSKVLIYLEQEEKKREETKKGERQTKEYKKLKWVKVYSDLINELTQVNNTVNQIKTLVKINGLSEETVCKTKYLLQNITIKNVRTEYLQNELIKYLESTQKSLPEQKQILCTSDIIESSFGKYKNYISDNPMTGITNLALCLSTFTSNLSEDEIKSGLEKITINDLNIWTKKNIGETNMSKRRKIFKKEGGNLKVNFS